MKNSLLKFVLAFFLMVFCNVFSFQQKDPNCQPYPYSRVALKHREHKGVGWDKGYSTLSLFLAPRNNHVLIPFFDARFHAFNDGYIASNLGVGARLLQYLIMLLLDLTLTMTLENTNLFHHTKLQVE